MTLTWLILVPLLGGLLAWLSGRLGDPLPRWVALAAVVAELGLVLGLWLSDLQPYPIDGRGAWLLEHLVDWIPALGIRYHLALDGISLVLLGLTGLMGLLAVGASWDEVSRQPGAFYACLLWTLAGITGVFLAIDLFLFYVFWEVMLIPMVFLIGVWGHARRIYAAVKFFIYTQVGSLLMLVAMLVLYFIHGRTTGEYTFDLPALLGTRLDPDLAWWLLLGFCAAFAIKLPVVGLHNWLPDAHAEAPTAGSILLAGLLLKTGAYGLIRFALPLFPQAAAELAPWAMGLAAVGILYGAKLAFAQTDLKRLVAYTSVSHMGFALLGIFAWTAMSLQGTLLQLVCHALSTGALFALAGMMMHRLHSRDLGRMGGFWQGAPRMGAMALLLSLASLGLPGMGNFIAEFLILFGSFDAAPLATVLAAAGLVLATIYSLRLFQRAFHGPLPDAGPLTDLGRRELAVLGLAVVLLIWLGLYPRPAIETARPAVEQTLRCDRALVRLAAVDAPKRMGGGRP